MDTREISQACIEKLSKEKDRKSGRMYPHLTYGHTKIHGVKSRRNSPLHSVLCQAFVSQCEVPALTCNQTPKSTGAPFYPKTPQHIFLEGCWPPQNRKVSSSSSSCLPARPWLDMSESSMTSSWRKTNGKHLHSQQVALSNDDPCTRNRVAQWNKNSNTNKGNYSSKLSLAQRIVCNIYMDLRHSKYRSLGEQTHSPES